MGRRERKQELTREAIVHAAEALFAKRDYAAVTVDEIALEADVAKGTVYNHFLSKEEIAAALADKIFRSGLPLVEEMLKEGISPNKILEALFAAGSDWAQQNPKLAHATSAHVLRQAFSDTAEDSQVKGYGSLLELILRLVKMSQSTGQTRDDIPPVELARMLTLMHAQTLWLATAVPGEELIADRMARCLRVCLEGTTPRHAPQ